MKHFLLLFSFLALSLLTLPPVQAHSIGRPDSGNILVTDPIQVYPNPATHYFGITETEQVNKIYVYNLVGKRLKQFVDIAQDKHYFIGDLPRGMYLVQMVDVNNQVIVTQRVSKR